MSASTSKPVHLAKTHALPKGAEAQDLTLEISGSFALADMRRLGEFLSTSAGNVEVRLSLSYQPLLALGKRWQLRGEALAQLAMPCSRCLAPCELHLQVALMAYLQNSSSHSDAAELELDECDIDSIMLNARGELELFEFIEDELLLSLPSVPLHESSDLCAADMMATADRYRLDTSVNKESQSPFAVLAQLKNKQSSH